jgi:hypothetical protein
MAAGVRLERTQALVQNMEILSMALGPALAISAVLVLGKIKLLALASGMYALAVLCWVRLPQPDQGPPTSAASGGLREVAADLRLAFGMLVRIRPVFALSWLNFAINLVYSAALGANAAVVTGVLKAPQSAYGLLNICVGVAGFANLALTPLALKRFDVRALGAAGFCVLSAAMITMGLARDFPLYAVAYVVGLVGVAYFNVYNRTQRVKLIPSEHLGKVMGPFFLINVMAYPLGGMLIATVGAAAGPQVLVEWLAVALSAFGAFYVPTVMRSVRRALDAQDERQPGLAPNPAESVA